MEIPFIACGASGNRRLLQRFTRMEIPFTACGGSGNWPYIRNTPKGVSSTGAFRLALNDSPSTIRVSAGSMMPSSQSLALA